MWLGKAALQMALPADDCHAAPRTTFPPRLAMTILNYVRRFAQIARSGGHKNN
jgi:hypothetical protein